MMFYGCLIFFPAQLLIATESFSFPSRVISLPFRIIPNAYDSLSTSATLVFAGTSRLTEGDSSTPAQLKNSTLDGSALNVTPKTIDVLLKDHKPLGCTIEESLVPSPDLLRAEYLPIIISKLVSGGNAENAGLQVGDVIVGVSAVFGGGIQDSSSLGLYRLQSLISGRSPEKPLLIRVLRGSNLLQQHEDALMEICMSDTADDKSWESCVITSVHSYDENQFFEDEKMTSLCAESEDEAECLLTTIWGEENLFLAEEPTNSGEDEKFSSEEQQSPKKTRKEVAPWSSRSSPSGTYAHNPETSKIERID